MSIRTCDGEPFKLEIITQKGTPSEAVVKPAIGRNDDQAYERQIAPFSEEVISSYLLSISGYSREQLVLVEKKQTIFALIYLNFWVEGINNFREFIFEHAEFLMEDVPKSIDDLSEKPFSYIINFPLVFEIGDGTPRAISPSHCKKGIDIARSRNRK